MYGKARPQGRHTDATQVDRYPILSLVKKQIGRAEVHQASGTGMALRNKSLIRKFLKTGRCVYHAVPAWHKARGRRI